MPLSIAVLDPLPVFRRGMIATLGEAGFDPEAPDDLLTWIRQENRRVVLLTLEAPSDWALLEEIRHAREDLIVVAVGRLYCSRRGRVRLSIDVVLVTASGLKPRLTSALQEENADSSGLNTLLRTIYSSSMSEPTVVEDDDEKTVEEDEEYNSETNNRLGDEEFEEEADEMTRVVADELQETPADAYPPDQGEGPDAVPPGWSKPEGGA